MAPRNQLREYDTMIAESPMRHAIFNKPFSSFRRRTENLLDQITGGTLSPEVIEEQRREQEKTRALTCRYCKVVYANESGLAKHYDLFPVHFTAERQRKAAAPPVNGPSPRLADVHKAEAHDASPQSQQSARRIRQNTQPDMPSQQRMVNPPKRKPSAPVLMQDQRTGTDASASTVSLDRRSSMQSSRSRSTPNLPRSSNHIIPSSRPLPTVPVTSQPPVLSTIAPSFHANLPRKVSWNTPPPQEDDSEIAYYASSPPHLVNNTADRYMPFDSHTRFASDFYSPSPSGGASGYDFAFDSSPSPYALANAFSNGTSNVNSSSMRTNTIPHAAAMLPSFEFESSFTGISRDGVPLPPSARPIAANQTYDVLGERNRDQGARSSARIASRSAFDSQSVEQSNPRHNSHSRQPTNESIKAARPSLPTSFSGVVRAVVATGASGADGSAIMPANASSVRQTMPEEAWSRLADDEEEEKKPRSPARSRTGSASGRHWGSLMNALPGSPEQDKTQILQQAKETKALQPIKTGVTSFSAEEPASPTVSSGKASPVRSRRNTNPFLNRDFMRAMPGALKTPPLSPGSPWAGLSSSPGNPFRQLSDEETEEGAYFDALDAPRTPADEVRAVTAKTAARLGHLGLSSTTAHESSG